MQSHEPTRIEKNGAGSRLAGVQTCAEALADLEWVASIGSTIVRVHQHAATLPRLTGAPASRRSDEAWKRRIVVERGCSRLKKWLASPLDRTRPARHYLAAAD